MIPFAFGLANDDAILNSYISLMRDDQKLWTNYGLRSLSKSSSKFQSRDNYWTGPIWININYLVLRAIKLYYWSNQNAKDLYKDLIK